MGVCSLHVVINAGSGNQDISCCVPILEYVKYFNCSEELIYRVLIVSNLIAIYIKSYIGRILGFCGVTLKVAVAGEVISYLYKQDFDFVKSTVANSLMIVSGMIWDGTKCSCTG